MCVAPWSNPCVVTPGLKTLCVQGDPRRRLVLDYDPAAVILPHRAAADHVVDLEFALRNCHTSYMKASVYEHRELLPDWLCRVPLIVHNVHGFVPTKPRLHVLVRRP